MDAHPRSAAETVADDVLHGHVSAETGTVIDVGGLAERRVRAGHVVMVAADDHRSGQPAVFDCLIECSGNLGAAFGVRIQDTGLRAHHQMVFFGSLDPGDVVFHLLGNLLRSSLADLAKHIHGQVVGDLQVLGFSGSAHPAERAESVVEAHGSHDILHVGRIAERAVLFHDVGSGARRLQKEGVAVIEEVHALGSQLVDGGHLTAQTLFYSGFEFLGLLSHHDLGVFKGDAHRIIAASPRVVQ